MHIAGFQAWWRGTHSWIYIYVHVVYIEKVQVHEERVCAPVHTCTFTCVYFLQYNVLVLAYIRYKTWYMYMYNVYVHVHLYVHLYPIVLHIHLTHKYGYMYDFVHVHTMYVHLCTCTNHTVHKQRLLVCVVESQTQCCGSQASMMVRRPFAETAVQQNHNAA